ncbi:MAG: hypothetical protein VYC70_12105 [Verrucomicrobiota bacterium]|nr:hypothetical protein [Verrucomicrobiota bacterium]
MKNQIIALTLVMLTLSLCSCTQLQSIGIPTINSLKGSNNKKIKEPNLIGKTTKEKKDSSENSNTTPQKNSPELPKSKISEEPEKPKKPQIVPPSKPEEKQPIQKEEKGNQSILKPKLPEREGVLPPS